MGHFNVSLMMRMLLQYLAFFIAIALPLVKAHSWIACTDYLEENAGDWNSDLCRAFPRHAQQYAPKGSFGVDTGFDHRPQENSPCKSSRDDNGAYNSDYNMAVYYPGQKVILAHPTKNHVADTRCTNKYIPDHGNYLYASEKDAYQDPTLSQFLANQIVDLGVSLFGHEIPDSTINTYPKPGYQNAPKFCDNPDKALATYAFTVPDNLEPGRYTFMWEWLFN